MRFFARCLSALLGAALRLSATAPLPAAALSGPVVNATADVVAKDGQCTLREALISASGLPGEDRALQVLSGASARLENIVIQDADSELSGAGISTRVMGEAFLASASRAS
jgi:CSLREA domain-containing protein